MNTLNSRKRQAIACVAICTLFSGITWAQDRSRIQDPPLPPTTPSDPTTTPGIVSPARPLTGTNAPDDRLPGSADRSVAGPLKPLDTTPRKPKANEESLDDSPPLANSKTKASTKEVTKSKKRPSGAKANSTKSAATKKHAAVS